MLRNLVRSKCENDNTGDLIWSVPGIIWTTRLSLGLVSTFRSREQGLRRWSSISTLILIERQAVLPGPCYDVDVCLRFHLAGQLSGPVNPPGVGVRYVQLSRHRVRAQVVAVSRVITGEEIELEMDELSAWKRVICRNERLDSLVGDDRWNNRVWNINVAQEVHWFAICVFHPPPYLSQQRTLLTREGKRVERDNKSDVTGKYLSRQWWCLKVCQIIPMVMTPVWEERKNSRDAQILMTANSWRHFIRLCLFAFIKSISALFPEWVNVDAISIEWKTDLGYRTWCASVAFYPETG